MDFFSDFNELGLFGYIVPILTVLAVVVPTWRKFGRSRGSSLGARILTTSLVSCLVLVGLAIALLIIGVIVFRISNPSII